MTIPYNHIVSSSEYFTFLRIIFRWRGSIWKSVIRELCVWTFGFYMVFSIYRFVLPLKLQHHFALFAMHCNDKLRYIPMDFMLGFFVNFVVDRWKNIFRNIGFIDNPALFIANYVHGDSVEQRLHRRAMVRHLCLTQVLVLRDISTQVRRRFPTLESVVDSGFMEPGEKKLLERAETTHARGYAKYWMPMSWVFAAGYEAREKGWITQDVLLNGLFCELAKYRDCLQQLCHYDWVPVPLAYTQVVFMAVRCYFFIATVARQSIITEGAPNKSWIDLYVPFMTMLQLIFYLGWLKVAEALMNPLGEDDDDFECNFIIDRNVAVAVAIVDESWNERPKPAPDRLFTGGSTRANGNAAGTAHLTHRNIEEDDPQKQEFSSSSLSHHQSLGDASFKDASSWGPGEWSSASKKALERSETLPMLSAIKQRFPWVSRSEDTINDKKSCRLPAAYEKGHSSVV